MVNNNGVFAISYNYTQYDFPVHPLGNFYESSYNYIIFNGNKFCAQLITDHDYFWTHYKDQCSEYTRNDYFINMNGTLTSVNKSQYYAHIKLTYISKVFDTIEIKLLILYLSVYNLLFILRYVTNIRLYITITGYLMVVNNTYAFANPSILFFIIVSCNFQKYL